jgi:hypothetical protein
LGFTPDDIRDPALRLYCIICDEQRLPTREQRQALTDLITPRPGDTVILLRADRMFDVSRIDDAAARVSVHEGIVLEKDAADIAREQLRRVSDRPATRWIENFTSPGVFRPYR